MYQNKFESERAKNDSLRETIEELYRELANAHARSSPEGEQEHYEGTLSADERPDNVVKPPKASGWGLGHTNSSRGDQREAQDRLSGESKTRNRPNRLCIGTGRHSAGDDTTSAHVHGNEHVDKRTVEKKPMSFEDTSAIQDDIRVLESEIGDH